MQKGLTGSESRKGATKKERRTGKRNGSRYRLPETKRKPLRRRRRGALLAAGAEGGFPLLPNTGGANKAKRRSDRGESPLPCHCADAPKLWQSKGSFSTCKKTFLRKLFFRCENSTFTRWSECENENPTAN